MKKAVNFFKETFDKHGISMGFGEVKLINNINVAFKIVSELFESDFRFGGDCYNRHTTGSITKVERIDKDRIALFSSDNNVEYYTAREYDPEFEWKEYHYKLNFLDSVIIGFVNIQRLEFRRLYEVNKCFS